MKVEVDVLRLPVPSSPYGLCGRKATLNVDGFPVPPRSPVRRAGLARGDCQTGATVPPAMARRRDGSEVRNPPASRLSLGLHLPPSLSQRPIRQSGYPPYSGCRLVSQSVLAFAMCVCVCIYIYIYKQY